MQQTDETLHCTQCGKNISGSSSRFCDQCGSPVGLTVPPVAQQRAVRSSNIAHSAAIVFLVIVGLFVVVIFIIAPPPKPPGISTSQLGTTGDQQAKAEQVREEDRFRRMSPAEHLERVKSLLTVNTAPEFLSEALKHLAAIPPDTPEASAAAKIKRQYDVETRRESEQSARAQAAAEKKKAMQDAAAAKKRGIVEDDKRRQALALAFEEVMRQQGHEASVSTTSDQLWFDCSSALEPRSSCYAAYQSSKHLPSDLKAELRAVGITTLNFSPNGGMIPTWATNIR